MKQCLVIICLLNLLSIITSSDEIINKEVFRRINLKGNVIYVEIDVTLEEKAKVPYEYILTKNNSKSLINIKAVANQKTLQVVKIKEDNDYIHYSIELNGNKLFKVYEHYFEKLEFLPKKISVLDDQLELFIDTSNYPSVYATKSQSTHITLPSENTRIIKYTLRNAKKQNDKIIYSHDSLVKPLKLYRIEIHYMNNIPMTVFNKASKSYYVSHWGNIAVTEEYSLENIGASLTGEFGRIDYQDEYGRKGGNNALLQIKATLPLRSWGLWYRDEIGNVSTSYAKREWNNVELILWPRFPILGGWKSNFGIGYNLPSKFHVTTNGNGNYMVNLTYALPFDDMLAKEYTFKVVLPEGADNIKVNLPIEKHYQVSYDKEYGCLDLFGRKAVIIKLDNMYDEYKTNVLISYDYKTSMLFIKPFILMGYFLVLFLVMIIYGRANLSLRGKKEEIKEEKKEKTE